jgi:hypothetical protein
MTDMKRYDGDLQMFSEQPGAVNVHHLQFLRWLIDQGRLEHSAAGPPSGPLVDAPAEEEALVEAT